MAEAKKPKPISQGGSKVKASKQNYNNENRDKKNKLIRAARHKKYLEKMARRRIARKGHVLPSRIKRLMRRQNKSRKAESPVVLSTKAETV